MDFSILYVLQHLHNAVLDRVMVGITSLGNAGWIWIALTAVFLILPKYRKCGVRMAIALILDLILCNLVLKPLAARPRPCWIDEQVKLLVAAPKDYSFPSGHSAASFAAAVSIFVMHKKEGAAFFREGGKKADLFFYAEKDPVRSGCGACLIKNRQLQCAGERQVFRCKNRKSAA